MASSNFRIDESARAAPAFAVETLPVERGPGIGAFLRSRLHKLGIVSTWDLLTHRPSRYEDRTRLTPMHRLRYGENALVEGVVCDHQPGRRGTSLLVMLADEHGGVGLRFFHGARHGAARLTPGTRLRAFGEVRAGVAGPELVHPEIEFPHEGVQAPLPRHLTAVYPTTQGLTQPTLRRLVAQALAACALRGLPESRAPRAAACGASLLACVETLHRPPPGTDIAALIGGTHPIMRRLAFEELLAHRLAVRRVRSRLRAQRAPPLDGDRSLATRLLATLPFTLTSAQERVIDEIRADLARDKPMLRLVQGDVGSGKTIVAAIACADAIAQGFQAAFVAPTELLAVQHAATLARWFEPLGVTPLLLTGSLTAAERRKRRAAIAAGHIPLAVGTHALFAEGVDFARLALVVIDEQHRFGVHQRLLLNQKGGADALLPHQLVMSATPIPRTLAMTEHAALEISVIDALPPGRTPVHTVAMPDARRGEVIARLGEQCRAGGQAYWVCPRIEEDEEDQTRAAEAAYRELGEALPDLAVALVHGRMDGATRADTLAGFSAGTTRVLVATTVIEVGVDVPRATLMVIDGAERMGLAQLHQLRGRVGRGSERSHCVLLYGKALSQAAKQRLAALRAHHDGFAIARLDLQLRGPGELLGTRQAGLAALRIADLARDEDLADALVEAARALEQDGAMRERVIRRWIGHAEAYGGV